MLADTLSPAAESPEPQPRWPQRLLAGVVGGSRVRWLLTTFALCVILPWFFSCPIGRHEPPDARQQRLREVVQLKLADPLHDYLREFPPESNEAKRNFRILVPVLARLISGQFWSVHVVRFGLQAVLLVALILAAERACLDRAAATGVALAVAGTMVGSSVWTDSFFWFDNCAYAFVALGLLARGPALAAVAMALGLFVDERVLCAAPLVALFQWVTLKNWRPLPGLVIGVVAYVVVRAVLSARFGIGNAFAGIGVASIIDANLPLLPAGFWFALEGGWLLLLLAAREESEARYAVAALFALTILLLFASTLVIDFSRSASYAFPATLVAAALLARAPTMPRSSLRRWAGIAAAVSLVVSDASVIWQTIVFESSLPVRIVQACLHRL